MHDRALTSTGLTMPLDFPVEPYEEVLSALRRHSESAPDAWREFALGWNALSYRFAAVAEHDEAFRESLRVDGFGPPPPARYRQEDGLFAFYGAGMSALETFGYGTWAAVWAAGDDDFALSTAEQRRDVTLPRLRDGLAVSYAGEPLVAALRGVLDSDELRRWREIRNALVHRAVFPRLHTTAEAPASIGWGEMRLDGRTTARDRDWLAGSLAQLLGAAERFTRGRF
jgi:hypothetical protein